MRFAADELILLPSFFDQTMSHMNDAGALSLNELEDPFLREADRRAVQAFLETGAPVDPAVRARVRADYIREKAYRRHGNINIQDLLPPSTYDE